MEALVAQIAELHARTAELKLIIASTPGLENTKLRSGIYQLEAAIYVIERNAATACKAFAVKAGEAQAHT